MVELNSQVIGMSGGSPKVFFKVHSFRGRLTNMNMNITKMESINYKNTIVFIFDVFKSNFKMPVFSILKSLQTHIAI